MKHRKFYYVVGILLSVLLFYLFGCSNISRPAKELSNKNTDETNYIHSDEVKIFDKIKNAETSSKEYESTLKAEKIQGIKYRKGLLKVAIKEQSLQNVLYTIAELTEVKIINFDFKDETITMEFDYITLEKGLEQLLRKKSYVFLYNSEPISNDSILTKVYVFPKSEEWKLTKIIDEDENVVLNEFGNASSLEEELIEGPFERELNLFRGMEQSTQGENFGSSFADDVWVQTPFNQNPFESNTEFSNTEFESQWNSVDSPVGEDLFYNPFE